NWKILDGLYNQGHTSNIKMTDLKQEGFKADFSKGKIHVKNYLLKRVSVFTFKFFLSKEE
ncbi:MAG: hypothetical protein WBA74_24665, partial [Cyclobacteriaceae bacterium]